MSNERYQDDEGLKTINQSSSSNARYSKDTIQDVEKLVSTYKNSSEPSTSTSISAGCDKTRNADESAKEHTTKTAEPPVTCFSHQIHLVNSMPENMNNLDELGDRLKGYDDNRLKLIMERHYTPHTHHSGAHEISSRKNPGSDKKFGLFDDALGIKYVQDISGGNEKDKPYLQIEPFHCENIKTFDGADLSSLKDNVIAKEPSKANVYKVHFFELFNCLKI